MLRIFRKLRFKWLKKAKIKAYFLYAFGEIALIVIGILIALSINNWNESKKNRIIERKSLEEIRSGLISDFEQMTQNLAVNETSLNATQYLTQTFQKDEPYHDSLAIHFHNFFIQSRRWLPQTSAYETLKSRGMDIISKDSLRLSIVQYYDVFYKALENGDEADYQLFQENKQVMLTDFKDYSLFEKVIPIDFGELKKDQIFKNRLNYLIEFRSSQIETYRSFILHCLQLIKNIKEELICLETGKKYKGKQVTFKLAQYLDAETIYVTGDFLQWYPEAMPMQKIDNTWQAQINLQSEQTYHYKFIVDGKWIHDPANDRRVPDGHSGYNSILILQ